MEQVEQALDEFVQAITTNDVEKFAALLKSSTLIDIHYSDDLFLRRAVGGNKVVLARLLLEYGSVGKYKGKMNDQLILACKRGYLEMAELLCSHGVESDVVGLTLIYNACQNNHLKIVKFLLARGVKADEGSFYVACSRGNLEICKLLLDQSFEPVVDTGIKNSALARWTISHGQLKVGKFLLQNGAEILAELQTVTRVIESYCSDEAREEIYKKLNFIVSWKIYKAPNFLFADILARMKETNNLFVVLDSFENFADKERLITIYLSGIDLSKQENFVTHEPMLKEYVTTIKAELSDYLLQDLITIVLRFL